MKPALAKGTLLLSLVLLAGPAAARELEGVEVPDVITAPDGHTLAILGAGVRTKWFFKVYVGALYAEKPTFNPGTFMRTEEVKHIELHMLRDLPKEKIVEAIRDGFESNPKANLIALQSRLDQLVDAVPNTRKGQNITLTYVPGRGTYLGGAAKDVLIPGKDFADALFAVWMGERPVDEELKKKLLGG